MPVLPSWSPAVAAAFALASLWAFEGIFPLLIDRKGTLRRRLLNLGVGLLGYGTAALALSGAILAVASWSASTGFGLLRWVDLPWPIAWVIAFLLLDFWSYMWHVCCHKFRFLWRFHLVHHHDEHVDATTAFRFHVLEIIGKGLWTLPIIALGGITMPQILLCECITVILVVFHHGNLRMPRRLEFVMRSAIVTPAMHLVHHSRWQPETDSNYGAVLSIWDRLFRTYRVRRDPTKIDFGIDGYEGEEVRTLWGILRTPFGPIKSEFGQTPEEFLDGTEQPRPGDGRFDDRLVEAKPLSETTMS